MRGSRVAVICNPNNPDGGYLPKHEVLRLLDALVDLDLVSSTSRSCDFVDAEPYPGVAAEAVMRPNVIVLRSLGKNFGLHGIRFGYMVANPALAGKVARRAAQVEPQLLRRGRRVHDASSHGASTRRACRRLRRDRRAMFHQLCCAARS